MDTQLFLFRLCTYVCQPVVGALQSDSTWRLHRSTKQLVTSWRMEMILSVTIALFHSRRLPRSKFNVFKIISRYSLMRRPGSLITSCSLKLMPAKHSLTSVSHPLLTCTSDSFQAFDHCSKLLGPLRQNLFSCLTCNPPPESPLEPYHPAGICYSCSIACHGEHTLVELFARRNFTCDCGTTRMPSTSPCTLRIDPVTSIKGPVHSQTAAKGNIYNKNFQNRFCGCGELHNPYEEKGTMFQCLGLSNEEDGGCGEDWWHPECVLGIGRDWLQETKPEINHTTPPHEDNHEETEESGYPLPPGFPKEDEFEGFICYKCVDANPWIKSYAGSPGFLMPVFRNELSQPVTTTENEPATRSRTSSKGLAPESITIGDSHQQSSSSRSSLDPAILEEDCADG